MAIKIQEPTLFLRVDKKKKMVVCLYTYGFRE